ncbi:MAG: DUF5942 domain-containing protein [Cyanobacteriota bacterium]|jgi:serine protease
MKKLLLAILFFVGLFWALSTYSGLANQGTYDSIVLDFREDVGAAQIQNQVRQLGQQLKLAPRLNSIFSQDDHLFVLKGDQRLLKALRQSDLMKYTEYIEPNYLYSAYRAPNDPDYDKQWNLRSINVESAWDQTQGQGVTVAIIDTGISNVPDLKDTPMVPGYDFVNDREEASDDNGHGTHVAGTIGQSTNNGFGVAGIAYKASLMPLKVLSSSGGGTVADIAEAIRFAANHGAAVINMSLGGGGESQAMREAIDYAHAKGVVIVAAAGNASQNSASYPARYPHVLGVSALDASGSRAPYSNYGAGVDLSAPGGSTDGGKTGGILHNTVNPDTGESIFEYYQGTSMAAPHVAGVAALVKATGIQNPDKVAAILKQSVTPIQDDTLNYYGAGKLNADAAVKLALSGKITYHNVFRWLRDMGYLNPRFWIDADLMAWWPSVAMLTSACLLASYLRSSFPFRWNGPLLIGLVAGSSGLFFFKPLYLFDAPQWPFRILGSSIPELGSAIQGGALNPVTASVAIPFFFILLLLGHKSWKWFAIGTCLGVAAYLTVSAIWMPQMVWLGQGTLSRLFLGVNALLCLLLARLVVRSEARTI